jgi:alanine racemase
LGVATVDEAVELRDASITAPILVLSEPWGYDAYAACVSYAITPALYTAYGFEQLGAAAVAAATTATAHLKINTGMNRVGIDVQDVSRVADWLAQHSRVVLDGVFTHFACADDPNDDSVTLAQIDAFDRARATLADLGVCPRIAHAANSAATLRYPQARYDMVRSGISIYGLVPDAWMDEWSTPGDGFKLIDVLRPAMSLTSLIALLRQIDTGAGVSYGFPWRAARPSTIAVVPIGYADGLARNAGRNGCDVLIAGRRCPIVANVTMDQLLVDVTDLVDNGQQLAVGDLVVLIGAQGKQSIGAWEWGLARDSLAYEVVCAVSPRVPRRYL